MSELVKECNKLVMCDKCRSISCRLCEVHYGADERSVLHTVSYALTTELGHPCTASLACAWEEVSIEKCTVTAFCTIHLLYLLVRMIYRDIVKLLESDAVKTGSESKNRIDAAFELEIRLEFLSAERVLRLLIFL